MQTDQYLSYDSHHPQSVKRGVVKCLYDRSKNINKTSIIPEEKKHLASVLVCNGYPYSFVTSITNTDKNRKASDKEPTTHNGSAIHQRFI